MINRIFKAKFLPDLLRFFRGKGETLDFLTRKKWYRWRVSWHSTSFTLAGRCSWDSGRSAAGRRLTERSVQAENDFFSASVVLNNRCSSGLRHLQKKHLNDFYRLLNMTHKSALPFISLQLYNGALRAPAPLWDFNFLDTVLWYINGVNDKSIRNNHEQTP